jgi:hypothetical protein
MAPAPTQQTRSEPARQVQGGYCGIFTRLTVLTRLLASTKSPPFVTSVLRTMWPLVGLPSAESQRALLEGVLVATLNVKTALLFLTFIPLFIDASASAIRTVAHGRVGLFADQSRRLRGSSVRHTSRPKTRTTSAVVLSTTQMLPSSRTAFDVTTCINRSCDGAVKDAVLAAGIAKRATATRSASSFATHLVEEVMNPIRAGTLGPSRRDHDDGVHARAQPGASWRPEPADRMFLA